MNKVASYVVTGVLTLIFAGVMYYLCLPAWNIHSEGLMLFFIFVLLFAFFVLGFTGLRPMYKRSRTTKRKKGTVVMSTSFEVKQSASVTAVFVMAALAVLVAFWLLGSFFSSRLFHATAYSKILQVSDGAVTDIPSVDKTDAIALMDTASATKLGDREIGSLTDLVSQYEISSSDYTQVNIGNEPVKVAPLSYAGVFKWNNNKDKGIPGYVSVSPVNMDAEYIPLQEGMVYVPSAYFSQDLDRHIRFAYPTTIYDDLHFEVDEEGKPWYVATTYNYTIGLYGGKAVSGVILVNPMDGSMQKLSVAEVPSWVDVVYPGGLICKQYNDSAQLQRGYWNSVFGQNGCRKVTEYSSDDDDEDSGVKADYGYIAKEDDIWIYTGVTSVNGDSSNIGFIVANERTGETKFIEASGADEFSAMKAAEGEVQEKRYVASFPSLITVEDVPTYIMVLKDKSGLVKMYACVNVSQYNIVATASNQDDCIAKYQALLQGKITAEQATGEGTPEAAVSEPAVDTASYESRTITVAKLQTMDVDGNTYLYIVDAEGNVYKARYVDVEDMLFVNVGDVITIETDGVGYRYTRE